MKLHLLAIVVLAILALVFAPFLVVWSLNTLFPVLAIPYTIEVWFAVLLLNMTVTSIVKAAK